MPVGVVLFVILLMFLFWPDGAKLIAFGFSLLLSMLAWGVLR